MLYVNIYFWTDRYAACFWLAVLFARLCDLYFRNDKGESEGPWVQFGGQNRQVLCGTLRVPAGLRLRQLREGHQQMQDFFKMHSHGHRLQLHFPHPLLQETHEYVNIQTISGFSIPFRNAIIIQLLSFS